MKTVRYKSTLANVRKLIADVQDQISEFGAEDNKEGYEIVKGLQFLAEIGLKDLVQTFTFVHEKRKEISYTAKVINLGDNIEVLSVTRGNTNVYLSRTIKNEVIAYYYENVYIDPSPRIKHKPALKPFPYEF